MRNLSLRFGILAFLPGLILASGLEMRAACNADNCLRQVDATRPAAQLHMASSDCSSYLADSTTTVTVTPGFGKTITASTTTKTVKVTTTKFVATSTSEVIALSVVFTASVSTVIIPGKRAASKTVPTYASACTSAGQYASACSCYGIGPAFTHTATAQSVAPVTVTKTITTTISAQISATKTIVETSTSTRSHIIQETETIPASSFSLYAMGAPFDGNYLVVTEDTDYLLETNLFIDNPFVIPNFFTLSKGNLYSGDYVAVASVNDYYGFSFQEGIATDDPTRLVCEVTLEVLDCHTGPEGLTTFYGCLDESGEEFPPAVYFYPPNSEATVPYGCYPITFKQHPAT